MKSHHALTSDEGGPFLLEKGRWPLALFSLHQRLASFFARPEPYPHALLYLQAIISEIPRKNSWQIAEHAKQARPYGMQRLLSRATWDEEGVRNELRTLVGDCLNQPPTLPESAHHVPYPALIIDESGFPKRGTQSAGVQKQ
jgi:SRSO17 transposase